jgi:hypothetical protein
MKTVIFRRHDGKDAITFMADKIIAFTPHESDWMNKTSVFVLTANPEGGDEFIIGESYEDVKRKISEL